MTLHHRKVLSIEKGENGEGIQIIRTVIDCLQQCNLRCKYCHPGKTWEKTILPVDKIREIFQVGEKEGELEITLTGGEITLHPELPKILEATHILNKTVSTLITNATKITPKLLVMLRNSNVSRICVSLDGADADTHNSARGETFDCVLQGLKSLQEAGKPITVLTLAHQGNWRRVLEVSEMLVKNHWANQHHIIAPCYSGEAKRNYDKLKLTLADFFALQTQVDARFQEFLDNGLYVTFNSFWPATGGRPKADVSRSITLIQLAEQLKDCYIIVRPNGDVRLTAAAWGRETVGNALVGNLKEERFELLFNRSESNYRKGQIYQLPREEEARHKFHIGVDVASNQTDELLADKKQAPKMVKMIPVKRLAESDILKRELTAEMMGKMVLNIIAEQDRYRIVKNPSGVYILFDRVTANVTLLKEAEAERIAKLAGNFTK